MPKRKKLAYHTELIMLARTSKDYWQLRMARMLLALEADCDLRADYLQDVWEASDVPQK